MANTVKMKQSAVAGKVPTTAQLALGELAINTVDGKLFLKKNVSGTESIVDVTGSAAGVSSFNGGTTGLTPASATSGAITLGGTLAIANGGTGQTTRQAAMDALAGATTAGYYLRGNGADVVMSAIQAADVPTLNQNTTGTASNVTGTVAVANGGTGSTTAAGARTNLGLGSLATLSAIAQANLAANVVGNGPLFIAAKNVGQNVANNVSTKLTFGAEVADTNGNYDPATSRFTPTVAGYYAVMWNLYGAMSSTNVVQLVETFATKNGNSLGFSSVFQYTPSYPFNSGNSSAVAMAYLNGVNDYLEIYGRIVGDNTLTFPANGTFAAVLVRAG